MPTDCLLSVVVSRLGVVVVHKASTTTGHLWVEVAGVAEVVERTLAAILAGHRRLQGLGLTGGRAGCAGRGLLGALRRGMLRFLLGLARLGLCSAYGSGGGGSGDSSSYAQCQLRMMSK